MVDVVFFQAAGGKEPAREWMRSLDRADRLVVGTDLKTVQYGFPIGMPVCRPLKEGGLWEVRSSLPSGREARVVFFVTENRIIVLHGFIKKQRATPRREIEIALARRREHALAATSAEVGERGKVGR